jgi:hypothetical protein
VPDSEVKVAQTAALADPLAKAIDSESVDYGGGNVRQRQRTVTPGPKVATVTSVAHPGDTSAQNLLVANAARRGFVIRNESLDDLFVKYGDGASASSYTDLIAPGGTLREPDGSYCGLVTGAWSAAGGGAAARITELTT